MHNMVTTRTGARLLKIEVPALLAHVAREHIPRPRDRIGNAFLWTTAEIAAARKALAVPGRRRPPRKAARP